MNKDTEDKFVLLLSQIKDDDLKSEFLKCFLDVSSQIDELVIAKKTKCLPCISNCSNNNICNDNETEVEL